MARSCPNNTSGIACLVIACCLLLLNAAISSSSQSFRTADAGLNGYGAPKVFRHYIGVSTDIDLELENVPSALVDNEELEVHFILSFAIDANDVDGDGLFNSTNGQFLPYWNLKTLSPNSIRAFKAKHKNVKVIVSLGGDSISAPQLESTKNKTEPVPQSVMFDPQTPFSWLRNARDSLTSLVGKYDLDGVDIDYEHFEARPAIFAWCIGELVAHLKLSGAITVASIAPFPEVESHYVALWQRYAYLFDYVNFQFYVYPTNSTVQELVEYYNSATALYKSGSVLVAYSTDPDAFTHPSVNGITPTNMLLAYSELKCTQSNVAGMFVWVADTSAPSHFKHEMQAQGVLLANISSCAHPNSIKEKMTQLK